MLQAEDRVREEGIECEAWSGWREADRQLRRLAKRRAVLDAEESRWLVVARREEVHVHLGFGSFAEYVARVSGYEMRTAVERIRVAEALVDLPAMREAFGHGLVSYSAVRELTRFVRAPQETAWLDAIEGKSMREIEALVAGRAPGDRPEDPQNPELELWGLHLKLAPDVYAQFLEARRVLREEMGLSLDDSAFMAAVCERALRSTGATKRAPYQIALTVCEKCDRATQDAAGQVIDVAPSVLDRARCDADHIGRVDAAVPARMTSDIPDSIRRLVLRRDHHRCSVPGCRSSSYLEIHHIVPRGGGDHSPGNLVVLCGAHHRARHEQRLEITGTAPHQLCFSHADGTPYGADFFPEAERTLRGFGFKAHEAAAAVSRARAHVDADVRFDDVLRACLRECPRPSG